MSLNYLTDYLATLYSEISYKEFYRYIFPKGSLQEKGIYEKGRYNGIIVEITNERLPNEKLKVLRHTLTDDLEILDQVVSRNNFCLMSPITYAGKTRDSSLARELYALTFDLDSLQGSSDDPWGIMNMLNQMSYTGRLPKPTFIVSSGTGLHIYYVFEKPIPLFKNVLEQLEVFKKELTRMLWHDSISKLVDDIQYEPVCQGFRMVGTITKRGDRTKAFIIGDRVTMDYLNTFVREEYKVKTFSYKSDLTLKQAKKKYPDWYQKRIIGKKERGTWNFKRAVYDRWLERVKKEYKLGHRFWSVWVLAVTAKKCNITQDELEKDAFALLNLFNRDGNSKDNPFTKDDVLSALEGYDSAWFTYPIEKMAYRSDIALQKNKRNGRPQRQHLERARAVQEIDYPNGEWRNEDGAPTKQNIVEEWRKENPNGKKIDCVRDTGLSKPTVYKWWNGEVAKMRPREEDLFSAKSAQEVQKAFEIQERMREYE